MNEISSSINITRPRGIFLPENYPFTMILVVKPIMKNKIKNLSDASGKRY